MRCVGRDSAAADQRMAEPPAEYLCPITMMTMVDPVVTADGQTYERSAIEGWLLTRNTSPATGAVLRHKELAPNFALRKAIETWEETTQMRVPRADIEFPETRPIGAGASPSLADQVNAHGCSRGSCYAVVHGGSHGQIAQRIRAAPAQAEPRRLRRQRQHCFPASRTRQHSCFVAHRVGKSNGAFARRLQGH
jgi:hypothetical protein